CVAACAGEIVRHRHLLVPDLRDERVQAEAAWVAKTVYTPGAHGSRICHAVNSYSCRVQVDRYPCARLVSNALNRRRRFIGILNLYDPRSQQGRRHTLFYDCVLRVTTAFIVGVDVGSATPERRSDRSARSRAEAVVMVRRQLCSWADCFAIRVLR